MMDEPEKEPEKKNLSSRLSETFQSAVNSGESLRRIKNILVTIKSAASTTISLVVNPVTWVTLAIVVVVTILLVTSFAMVQLVGRSTNADGCSGVGGTTGVAVDTSDGNWQNRANSVAGWLMSAKFDFLGGKSMNINQAAAIIGNMYQESKVDPSTTQGGFISSNASNAEMSGVSGGGKAIGFIQWDGSRRDDLVKFADSNGKVWSDATTQLEFLQKELDSGGMGAMLVGAGFNESSKSATDLTKIFEEKYEAAGIPVMDARVNAANQFLGSFNGGYSSNTGGGCLTATDTSVVAGSVSITDTYLPYWKQHGGPSNTDAADPQGFYWGQCVSYAAWMDRTTTKYTDFQNNYRGAHFGNAYQWIAAARQIGIPVDKTPAVGSIAVRDRGTTSYVVGHVAYVTKVYPNGNIDVTEYNFTPYKFDRRVNINWKSNGDFTYFIHFEKK